MVVEALILRLTLIVGSSFGRALCVVGERKRNSLTCMDSAHNTKSALRIGKFSLMQYVVIIMALNTIFTIRFLMLGINLLASPEVGSTIDMTIKRLI